MNNDSDYLAALRRERGFAEQKGTSTDQIDAEIERVASGLGETVERRDDGDPETTDADAPAEDTAGRRAKRR